MKVLWLAAHPYSGSHDMHPVPWITALADQLFDKGIKITIVTIVSKIQEPIAKFNLGTYDLIVLKGPSGYVDVFTLFKKRIKILQGFLNQNIYDYDLVHVHGTEKQYASAITSEMSQKVPVVISIQGLISQYIKFINDFITIRRVMWEIGSVYEKLEVKKGHNFFCRTSWDTKCVKELNPNAKIFEVWEIMRQEFYKTKIQALGKNILFSGGSNSLKGLKHALQVHNKLLSDGEIILNVIGNCTWEYIQQVKKEYTLNNITSANVKLHGMVGAEKILEIYNDCFCLYHPSVIDNSPNSVCEAQLAGLPVLATNTGGVSSLISNNITGILLIANDIEGDYRSLKNFMSNVHLQKEIAENARKLALERHDFKSIANSVVDIYTELIN